MHRHAWRNIKFFHFPVICCHNRHAFLPHEIRVLDLFFAQISLPSQKYRSTNEQWNTLSCEKEKPMAVACYFTQCMAVTSGTSPARNMGFQYSFCGSLAQVSLLCRRTRNSELITGEKPVDGHYPWKRRIK
jgi:hypothetical protein